MSANALISKGVTIAVGDGASPEVFTTIGEVNSVSGLGLLMNFNEVDDLSSGTVVNQANGLAKYEEPSIEVYWLPADTQHAQLLTDAAAGTARNYRFTYTDTPATVLTMSLIVASVSPKLEKGGNITATITFKRNS